MLLREGSKKLYKSVVFDHTWGGVRLNHTLIAKLYCFKKNILYVFKYTQLVVCSCTSIKVIFIHLKHYFS